MENRYQHSSFDEQMRQLWQEQQTYRKRRNLFKNFTIDTPPPTVSGTLHIGHIFSYTQTDFIARYKRMTGHNVFYPFGFDCNGLATERFVEKKCNTNVSKLGRQGFIDLCLSVTEEMKVKFVDLWKTMGLSAELESTYSTISPEVVAIAQKSFIQLAAKNYVYVQKEPALYCTLCRTTVAQAELDDIVLPSVFYTIPFKTGNGQSVSIATTRPELLGACVAVFYNPDDLRYKHLHGSELISPLYDKKIKLIADKHVMIDKGTGLVMCATFGDKTDIEWFKKYNLNHIELIGRDGKLTAHADMIAGMTVLQARTQIVALLKEQGLILEEKPIEHAVNVHERCKNPIEYAVLSQWFVKVVDHADDFLKMADQIAWHPAYMKARFIDWVKNLSWDWCISRQRVFGIPFPVWYCNDCSKILIASVDMLPVDPQKTLLDACSDCGSKNIRPETDVMDTWNTSSLTPFICKDLYERMYGAVDQADFFPMSMRPQAHDIIRTWAFYTIVKSWMHTKSIPWTDIVISGYVLSENKEKISKSKDNAPMDPEKLLNMYAPDAIRFWAASGSLGQDTAFSVEQIGIGQKLMNKLWNAFKFIHLNSSLAAPLSTPVQELDLLNQWIVSETQEALLKYKAAFEKNEFSVALESVEPLFWHNFCDNYLEMIKDQLFNPAKYSTTQLQSTVWTLRHVGYQILQMYAVFMPHITEYLAQQIYVENMEHDSLHLSQFDQGAYCDQNIKRQMNIILLIVAKVRKLKTQAELSLKTDVGQLIVAGLSPEDAVIIKQHDYLIAGVCKAQSILCADHTKGNVIEVHDHANIWINVIE